MSPAVGVVTLEKKTEHIRRYVRVVLADRLRELAGGFDSALDVERPAAGCDGAREVADPLEHRRQPGDLAHGAGDDREREGADRFRPLRIELRRECHRMLARDVRDVRLVQRCDVLDHPGTQDGVALPVVHAHEPAEKYRRAACRPSWREPARREVARAAHRPPATASTVDARDAIHAFSPVS